ncbi:MAG: nicotinate (nicotinamide) nucleotide adenylyltransferase [Candidatus Planktophila sp.]|nr:nicotinate (nicotinamide) nucleotide adenylyltransferase [Candidatus Planktophila sp.]
MSRVGIYGGTFDPIHQGHLHVITQLFEKDLVDQLLVIPAGEPLLRSHAPVASAQQRRTMCQLALADLPSEIAAKVQVNPIEVLRTGPSYAIDTVEAVAQNFPGDTIILVVGQDAAEKLDQWHRIEELRTIVQFLVIGRPGYSGDGIDIGALDVSATTIRQGLSAEVSSSVAAFIRENNLYDN